MFNTELLRPANFIAIGLISVVFTMLVNVAFNQIHNDEENSNGN